MSAPAAARFARDARGAVAVEFCFVAPVMLAIFLGGYSASLAVQASRKVTVTTRALADLTTQFAAISSTDMSNVLNAATQIMAPFNATTLSMRVSQITTDATGLRASVTWSSARVMNPYPQGQAITLPAIMQSPNVSYVLSETSYPYTSTIGFVPLSITITDRIYMLPRLSTSINYTN